MKTFKVSCLAWQIPYRIKEVLMILAYDKEKEIREKESKWENATEEEKEWESIKIKEDEMGRDNQLER